MRLHLADGSGEEYLQSHACSQLNNRDRSGYNTNACRRTGWRNRRDGVYDAAIAMYKATCAYCKWDDQGTVTISGMTERDSMASSPKLEEVRELVRRLA